MFWKKITKFTVLGGMLLLLGACSHLEEFAPREGFQSVEDPADPGVPAVLGSRSEPEPLVTSGPETVPTSSAVPVTPLPALPANHNPVHPSASFGPDIPIEQGGLSEIGLSAHTPSSGTPAAWQSVDESVPLQKVYAVLPLEYTASDGTRMSFDPLARIQPVEGSGTLRFVRGSPLLANADRFVEVRFQMRFPSRFVYNPGTGYWGSSFVTVDWLRFKLLACGVDQRCQILVEEIPGQTASASCVDVRSSCERYYHVRRDVTVFADHYKILVEGTPAADFADQNGYARLCSDSAQDCLYSHPYCVAGVCSAVARGGDYYQAETPPTLLSGN